jgi:hypothetical protein
MFSGNPYSYDIIVQKTKFKVTKAYYLWSKTDEQEIITFKSIIRNELNSLINKGAQLKFKVHPDVATIEIKFTTLTDVLAYWGGFFATIDVLFAFLAATYNGMLLDANIVNSIFSFMDEIPKPKHNSLKPLIVDNTTNMQGIYY